MTFADVAKVLGEPLPHSAFTYREWWANQTDAANRPQARAWIEAGFSVDEVHQNGNAGWVEFVRANAPPSLMTTLGVDRLNLAERLHLVQEIWDSLDSEPEAPPLTDAMRQELDRRLAVLEANPNAVSSWEEVEARVLARLRT
jgi:putative addiction module component (TIGR02574 family)